MTEEEPTGGPVAGPRLHLAFLTVFVIAACGLGYQLVAGAVSSYLLGDSVTQFSITIGLFLFALGIGSFLSKFVEERLADRFVQAELAVAVIGGFSAAILMMSYASVLWFRPVMYGLIVAVGTLCGVEIPLLLRILRRELAFKDLVAKVLTMDYVGALFVALLFPLVMVPRLGMVRTALAFGLLNAVVGMWSVSLLRAQLRRPVTLQLQALAAGLVLAVGWVFSPALVAFAEVELYMNDVVYAKTTPYQRIVVTRSPTDFQLFLNGALQFSSDDEYRYHEALVHPAFAVAAAPRRVLVLGGGDGLAVREVLRHPEVERVVLVDIDPGVTELGSDFEPLTDLNQGSLLDPRVELVHDDAMRWLEESRGLFDVAIVDFPDPHSFSLGKLYSRTFYRLLWDRIAADGAIAVQSTSPREARHSFWCIAATLEAAEWFVRPYHAPVPSFGEWGFALAAKHSFPVPRTVPDGLRYLDDEYLPTLFEFPRDLARPDAVEVNRLNTQALVRYYESEFRIQ